MATEKETDGTAIAPLADDATAQPLRYARQPRPNYSQIHASPLPVNVYPLPAFIPQNPLSLVRIAYTFLRHYFRPPSSHVVYTAYFSDDTRSIHVTDPPTIRTLWTQGFFGKGTLSRSEPQWLEEEKRRRGLLATETSTEVTQRRRAERREFKQDRALKEREAIEDELRRNENPAVATSRFLVEDGALVVPVHSKPDASSTENLIRNELVGTQAEINLKPNLNTAEIGQTSFAPVSSLDASTNSEDLEAEEDVVINEEHLQLSLEEAFFLAYSLDVLQITDCPGPGSRSIISVPKLFQLCRTHSYLPPVSPDALRPDDPFLLSYITYHHFRSLGWVVRSGIKFAVDFLLYHRGPAFSHAEFAVLITPSYSDPYWRSTPELRADVDERERRDWWWFSCMSRIQSQVLKTLVLVYVDVPPPAHKEMQGANVNDISAFLQRYRVREFLCKRWVPNRSRD